MAHVCPWWGGYFIDNRFRRLLHKPEAILAPYVQPGMRALDFGCGMGFFAIPMARLVGDQGRVIAADLQEKMLGILSKRAFKAGVGDRIDTHPCKKDSLGIVGSVDFALAFYSAHEVSDIRRLLDQVYECLGEGGRFLIVEPIMHVGKKWFGAMIFLSKDVGFIVEGQPRIRLSRAVLLAKGEG